MPLSRPPPPTPLSGTSAPCSQDPISASASLPTRRSNRRKSLNDHSKSDISVTSSLSEIIDPSAMSETSNSHPGYTVTKSANRKGPHYINCLTTDGSPSRLREPGPVTDSTGARCFWKAEDEDTKNLQDKWLKILGKTLAKHLGLIDEKTNDEDWRVSNLPANYKLYRYIKGTREDVYLLGCEYVAKFRTANEFSPHLYWLCTNDPNQSNRIRCLCKYCSGSKQSCVNSAFNLQSKSGASASPIAPSRTSHNKRKAEDDIAKESSRRKTMSEVNSQRNVRAANPASKPAARKSMPATYVSSFKKSVFNGPYVNRERDRDLAELRCAFRMAELVWCRLDKPIDGAQEGHPDAKIEYWPALCEERVLDSVPEVLVDKKLTAQDAPLAPALTRRRSLASTSHKSTEETFIKVTQRYVWKVRLLGTSDVFTKPESELLAYLNYPTPHNLFKIDINPSSLQHICDGHESGRPSIATFQTISQAITPFALSLQMSVHVKNYWSLMDRYDIPSLKRLEAKSVNNLQAEELQILYEDSTLPWFQYLWWGAEKIWSGELIRLIVQAKDLPKGLRPVSQGGEKRCFFLKITGIYRSEQEKGMIKGPIFELAQLKQKELDESDPDPDFGEAFQDPSTSHHAIVIRYMPQPPVGYYFRRLTPIGKEHHLVLQHIAGRYYPPEQLSIPPTVELVNGVVNDNTTQQSPARRSLSLCGLDEGKWLHMHCSKWIGDRKDCLKAAEAAAEQDLLSWKDKPAKETNGVEKDMVVEKDIVVQKDIVVEKEIVVKEDMVVEKEIVVDGGSGGDVNGEGKGLEKTDPAMSQDEHQQQQQELQQPAQAVEAGLSANDVPQQEQAQVVEPVLSADDIPQQQQEAQVAEPVLSANDVPQQEQHTEVVEAVLSANDIPVAPVQPKDSGLESSTEVNGSFDLVSVSHSTTLLTPSNPVGVENENLISIQVDGPTLSNDSNFAHIDFTNGLDPSDLLPLSTAQELIISSNSNGLNAACELDEAQALLKEVFEGN